MKQEKRNFKEIDITAVNLTQKVMEKHVVDHLYRNQPAFNLVPTPAHLKSNGTKNLIYVVQIACVLKKQIQVVITT